MNHLTKEHTFKIANVSWLEAKRRLAPENDKEKALMDGNENFIRQVYQAGFFAGMIAGRRVLKTIQAGEQP